MTQHRLNLSRQTRICIVLCIDIVFFLVELIIGHMVGSLALIADSYHLLNDIMSLIIGLYAIKLSKRTTYNDADTRYTYGWHRAEILAALVNAVFLLALSFSIFVDAISRFSDKPEVNNPKLIVIVGSVGLTSGLVGMFLFHEHGHGGGGHSHGNGHGHSHGKEKESRPTDASDARGTTDSDIKMSKDRDDQVSRRRSISAMATGPSAYSSDEQDVGDGVDEVGDNHASDAYSDHPAATRAYVVQAAREIEQLEHEHERGAAHQYHGGEVVKVEKENSSGSVHLPSLPSSQSVATIDTTTSPVKKPKPMSSGALNMRGLMLHVFGDALGNVGVIASGLIIWFAQGEWRFYMDPVASLVITAIIVFNTVPLARSASYILLQCVPRGISLQEVGDAIRKVKGVEDVHELHIWQLSENKVVASVHVRVVKTNAHSAGNGNGADKKIQTKKSKATEKGNGEYSMLASMDGHSDVDVDEKAEDIQAEVLTCPHTLAAKRERDFMHVAAEIRRRLHDHGIHSSTIQPEYADEDEDGEVRVSARGGGQRRHVRIVCDEENNRLGSKIGLFGRLFGRKNVRQEGDVEMGVGAARCSGESVGGDAVTPTGKSAQISSCLIMCPSNQQECNPAENACCPPPKLVDV